MLKYMKKYWIFAILAAFFMICEVYVDMLQPKYMAAIVDQGILGLDSGGKPDLELIRTIGIRMILVVLCGGLCGMASGLMANLCSQRYGNTVRKTCFDAIMKLSFQQTDAYTTGSLITRVTNDVSQVERLVQQSVRGFIRCFMFMIVGTYTLMSLDQHFLVIIACAFPLVLLNVGFVLWKTNPLFTLLQKKLDSMNSVIQENVGGARVVKAFVQEEREEQRFGQANEDLSDTQLRVLLTMSYMRPVMNIILNTATVALIYIGSINVQAGNIQPGHVMAAVTYIAQILSGMMMLAMIFQTMSRGMASAKRLKEIINAEPPIRDGCEEVRPAGKGSVAFRKACFAFPNGSGELLFDIDLEIHPGETVAIVGATGSGKSALVNLIPRFYDVTAGSVEVDGIDVREYKLSDLRDRVAVVPQKNELFSTTIRENIAIGNPEASEEEIRAAARAAQAEDFILEQENGYDTAVAEGGMSLSGGQRQRIAISRALLKRSEIMIFDDSTSALDLRTEAALYKALDREYAGTTRIIIAQRIATAQRADRIAVLSDGRIIACDTHDVLLQTCPVYQDICDSQMEKGGAV